MVLAVKSSIVKSRIRKIEECVAYLEGIRKLPERLFLADRPARAAAERLLQVAIQSLLDIGSHIIAERGFREADGYAEIIDILGEETPPIPGGTSWRPTRRTTTGTSTSGSISQASHPVPSPRITPR